MTEEVIKLFSCRMKIEIQESKFRAIATIFSCIRHSTISAVRGVYSMKINTMGDMYYAMQTYY